jgi:hypothetical protein
MEYGGYIEDNDNTWHELIRDAEYHGDQIFISELSDLKETLIEDENTTDTDKPALTFGYDFGLLLRTLSGPAHRSDRGASFLWGVILAYCANTTGQVSGEEQIYEMIQEEFNKRSKRHFEHAISYLTKQEKLERYKPSRIVQSVLTEYDIEFSELLDSLIQNSAGWRIYSDDEIDSLRKIDKPIVREIVEEMLEDDFLNKVRGITTGLKEEWENIETASSPGVRASEILEAIWNKETPSSNEIAQEISTTTKYRKQVTQTLNKLSKEGKNPHPDVITVYLHGSLVEWIQPEEKSGGWELTAYGEFLCYFVFEKEMNIEWLHGIAVEHKISVNASIADGYSEETGDDLKLVRRGSKPIIESKKL